MSVKYHIAYSMTSNGPSRVQIVSLRADDVVEFVASRPPTAEYLWRDEVTLDELRDMFAREKITDAATTFEPILTKLRASL